MLIKLNHNNFLKNNKMKFKQKQINQKIKTKKQIKIVRNTNI